MTDLFLKILNMSISAGWVVLAVLILRLLFRKAPRWIAVLLWGVVALRLLCPFSIESALSLIPSAETVDPQIMLGGTPSVNTGIPVINNAVNPVIGSSLAHAKGGYSISALQFLVAALSVLWIAGMAALIIYTAVSYLRLRHKIGTAVLLRDNIYQSENVASPFVLGIIKPKIYLPFSISEQDTEHVIAHEKAHIRRLDHWWKPLSFLILTLHWFNPLMWVAYVLLCRDIELACDEKVIKDLGAEQRANYSQALLTCSVSRRTIAACPLAFGEVGVKNRVKTVLSYKKPAFWIIVVAIIASIVAAVCFLTNPATTTLGEIEGTKLTESILDASNVWAVNQDGETYRSIGTVSRDLLRDLANIRISKREASKNREDRKAAHSLVIVPRQTDILHTSSAMVGIYINFDKDFKTVFLDGDAKPTFSYKVKDPAKAKEVFESIVSYNGSEPAVDATDENAVSDVKVDRLKEKFPEYFGLTTAKGLEVYVWPTADNVYNCGLFPGVNRVYQNNEIWKLSQNPATLYEMRIIIAYYLSVGAVTRDGVSVIAISMPSDGREYIVDDKYRKTVADLFWDEFPIIENPNYVGYFDAATFDIDGDGRDEQCTIGYGPTSGIFTFTFTATEDGVREYFNIFTSSWMNPHFGLNESGEVVLVGEQNGEVRQMSLSVEGGNIVIHSDEQDVGYWGEQGLDSPYAPGVDLGVSYSFTASEDFAKPTFTLQKDGTFTFMFSVISSYLGFGKYELEGDRLTMRTSDGKFVYYFDKSGDDMIFDAKNSSKMTWFSGMTDGAVFEKVC